MSASVTVRPNDSHSWPISTSSKNKWLSENAIALARGLSGTEHRFGAASLFELRRVASGAAGLSVRFPTDPVLSPRIHKEDLDTFTGHCVQVMLLVRALMLAQSRISFYRNNCPGFAPGHYQLP